jgi:hypothetical protein
MVDIDALSYEEDVPKSITSGRRGNFKQGWTRAVEGKEYQDVLSKLI